MPAAGLEPCEVVKYLHPELRAVWANLDGAPPAVAEATAQLLPFGSRAALETLDLVIPGHLIDEHGHRKLHLTALGYAVMAEAAAEMDHTTTGTVDWTARANEAVQELEASSLHEQ